MAGWWSSAAPAPSRSAITPARPARSSSRNAAATANRWSHLRPIPTGATPADTTDDEPPTSGPIGIDVVRPGRGLVTCTEFHGELIRENGRYLVETEGGHVVGRASSYRAGAQMLSRHHGYQPGPIEIDHEHRTYGHS